MEILALFFGWLVLSTDPMGSMEEKCQQKNGKACYSRGLQEFERIKAHKLYSDQEVRKTAAAEYFKKSCDHGYTQGCTEHSNFLEYKKYRDEENQKLRESRYLPK